MIDGSTLSIIGMIVTAVLAYIGASKGVAAKLGELDAKVDQLSARVDKHNSVMERQAALEERTRWLEAEIKKVNKSNES